MNAENIVASYSLMSEPRQLNTGTVTLSLEATHTGAGQCPGSTGQRVCEIAPGSAVAIPYQRTSTYTVGQKSVPFFVDKVVLCAMK